MTPDNQSSFVGIRVQVFSREATERIEKVVKAENLAHNRLALNSTQSILDSVFYLVSHRNEISWLLKSLFAGWPTNPSENEKIEIHVCKADGTTVSIKMENTPPEKLLEILGGSVKDVIIDIGISPNNSRNQ
ncbi:hypothetical protein [Serratia ureilytica]|uniref:hypothetical protein n=1 Tax=Serratia ureilytica TaxID=300181 RepID=UPI0018E7646D|nr:hypothetical protein [Serratia ureilytica]MBJ2093892.1 hypothetical protein [Serratia ureilytica]